MWAAVQSGFTSLISMVGEFVSSLTGESGSLSALLPLFAVGIAISLLLLCVKVVRSIVWGA